MAAYVIVDIEVTDPETYQKYIEVAPATIEAYGGRYIVRGGAAEKLEGDWDPRRVVVLEFESLERAKAWWASDEYAEPKKLRQSASNANMIVVELA
jgi:uncharacterized protein (DUF1330 family)